MVFFVKWDGFLDLLCFEWEILIWLLDGVGVGECEVGVVVFD